MEGRLVTILALDVVGYARLMHRNEEATLVNLSACRGMVDHHISERGGRIFGSAGDSVIAEFDSPVQAVRCAVAIQTQMSDPDRTPSQDPEFLFRCGINLGDVIREVNNLFGEGVNVAARLEAIAEPGGLCISQSVFEHIEGRVEADFVNFGPMNLKNIGKPVTVYGWLSDRAEQRVENPLQDKPVVAVLEFETLGAVGQSFLAEGLSEEIITTLSKVPGLCVVSRHSSAAYAARDVDIRRIGMELGASHILEGSIREVGNRVRISTQLLDATSRQHVWTDRYDRELEDIFDLQDDISLSIAKALHGEILEGEMAFERGSGTRDLRAWELQVRANEAMRSITRETSAAARIMAQKALIIDPDYASAMTTLALTHGLDARHGFSPSRARSLTLMREWAEQALSIDDRSAEAHGVLGFADNIEGKNTSAQNHFQRALEINPSHAEVTIRLALSQIFNGEEAQAVRTAERAMRLCPKHPPYYFGVYGFALRSVGRYEEAISAFRKYGAKVEGFGLIDLVIVYMQIGNEAAAREHAALLLRYRPNFTVREWAKTQLYSVKNGGNADIEALLKAGLPE
ncbi:adenylate/guanylate cyclase domain-containing protein [Shimia aestuarii]|uniref:TolB amino-terminal domain-containing protein n=1 Tax=Shimia aestuarii TaxID=254406 RepID=A0A1I4HH48_9RHOB|nr:tetratricopeptide repeat protein [Shimia aestuarii]SFL41535.1 TolB amino-terminal domain-containing protein [Shimia aestuarii]